MSLSLIIQFVTSVIFIPLWFYVYKKYQQSSGIFFLLFSICISIWFFLFSIVFSHTFEWDIILLLNKILYTASLLWMYSMLFFVIFYRKNKELNKWKQNLIFGWMAIIAIFAIFTPYILESVSYIEEKWRYIESYGNFYPVFATLYLLFIPLFIISSYLKLKSLKAINKIRLLYVIVWFAIFIFSWIIFLVVFPLLWKVIHDVNNIVFLIIPFYVLTLLSIRGYKFLNVNILLWKIIIFLISIIGSIFITTLIKNYYVQIWVWWINEHYNLWDLVIWIILFYSLYNLSSFFIYSHAYTNKFLHNIHLIKKQIWYTTGIDDLNFALKKLFQNQLKIKYVNVDLSNQTNQHAGLTFFFKNNIKYNYFLNDPVFLDENQHKFDNLKHLEQIDKKILLILPLYNNNQEIIWFLEVWRKKFKDYYYSDEINILHELSTYIENHIKYIDTYKKVHELSVNLDKQVDKQTFEYNQLINKQKEFISIISHEVKWPIASSIFQIDSIIEDFEEWNLQGKQLSKELHILNTLLLKTWDLVNKLFSIQQFEMNTKSLFLEQIKISELIHNEIKIFNRLEPNIEFITNINETIWYIALDKVQFRQVIDNLIWNAVKVVNRDTWKIYVSCKLVEQNMIKIVIEDNGKWFTDIEIKKIFEKYTTGWKSGIWLGMGLYLCKNIVEMHWWNIQADFWKKLWWARIIIKIPRR